MQLKKLLDEIIAKEVYKEVKVKRKLHYHSSEIPKDIVTKIKTDKDFLRLYKGELNKFLQKLGYENAEIIDIDPLSNSLLVSYTAHYSGCREFPEIHLKTLLIFYDEMGVDVSDPAVFDEIVEKARRD